MKLSTDIVSVDTIKSFKKREREKNNYCNWEKEIVFFGRYLSGLIILLIKNK